MCSSRAGDDKHVGLIVGLMMPIWTNYNTMHILMGNGHSTHKTSSDVLYLGKARFGQGAQQYMEQHYVSHRALAFCSQLP